MYWEVLPGATIAAQQWQMFAHLHPHLQVSINCGAIGVTQQQRMKPAGFSLRTLVPPIDFWQVVQTSAPLTPSLMTRWLFEDLSGDG
jgi:hypothetical protein